MRTRNRYGFWWKPGTGKTIGLLLRWLESPKRTLVVAQKSIATTAWLKDARAMGVPVTICLHHDRKKRLALLSTPGDGLIVTNWEQFKIHASEILKTGVRRVIFDESSKIKNRESSNAKYSMAFADRMEEVYLLSGTPAPNCPTELWAQLRTISPESVGRNFWSWAYHWFTPLTKTITVKGKDGKKYSKNVIEKWLHKPGTEAAFYKMVAEWSWALAKKDCLDLPAQSNELRLFDLSDAERKVYRDAVNVLRAVVPDPTNPSQSMRIETENGAMKLRQMTGGMVLVDSKPSIFGSSKLEELADVLDELGPKEPVLIWAEFTTSIDRIVAMLRERGESVATIDGRTKDVLPIVEAFQRGEITRIVAHPQAAGHGTDGLQRVCNYAVYYELSYSGEQHEQSRDRLHRGGQEKPVTYIYLLAEGTIDEDLLDCVEKKCDRQEVLLRQLGHKKG